MPNSNRVDRRNGMGGGFDVVWCGCWDQTEVYAKAKAKRLVRDT